MKEADGVVGTASLMGGGHALMLEHQALTHAILGSAIEVHRAIGPGMLESVYEECLCLELSERGLAFRRQAWLPLTYRRQAIANAFRVDLIVDEAVIVELKVVDEIRPVHEAQLVTYLRLTGFKVGLLINWNVCRLMDGVVRRVV